MAAGIAFSLLLTSAIVTIRSAVLRDGFPRSGLLFIAMLFATGAVAGGLVAAADGGLPTADVWSFGRRVSYTLLTVYAMRMAAVFAISTTTIATRLGLAPRWLTALGLTTGLVLLLSAGLVPWLELIFPLWVFVFILYILVVTLRPAHPSPAGGGWGGVCRERWENGLSPVSAQVRRALQGWARRARRRRPRAPHRV